MIVRWSVAEVNTDEVVGQGLSVIDAGRSFDGLPSIRCLWHLLGANGEITVDGEYAGGGIEPSWWACLS